MSWLVGKVRAALSVYVDLDVLQILETGSLTDRTDAASVLCHVISERHLKRLPMLLTTSEPPAAARQFERCIGSGVP